MTKKLLFVGGLHGDEEIGVNLCRDSENKQYSDKFDWILGNPKAITAGRRFFIEDLNRVFPGDIKSKIYEKKRAAEILKIAQQYKYVIDFHGTKSDSRIFGIVSNPTKSVLTFVKSIGLEKIVIWKSSKTTGPLTKFVNCGFEIECGPKNDVKTFTNLKIIILNFLSEQIKIIPEPNIFEVYGKLIKYQGKKKLCNFIEVKIQGEKFYPLLPGQYPGIICYKMRKIK